MEAVADLDPQTAGLVYSLDNAEERFENAKVAYLEAFETNPKYATEWHLTTVLETQAQYVIATEILPAEGQEDLEENIERFIQRVETDLTHARGESRSTSAATNLAEVITEAERRKVYAQILQGRRYNASKESA